MENPPLRTDEFDAMLAVSPPEDWRWLEERPVDWAPQVRFAGDLVFVIFYTQSTLYGEAIYRHVDAYRAGQYRNQSSVTKIAAAKGASAW